MKVDYAYLGVILVLIIMLIGSNQQIAQQRAQIEAREIVVLTTVKVMNDRINAQEDYMFRLNEERLRLLGLWKRIRPSVRARAFDDQ